MRKTSKLLSLCFISLSVSLFTLALCYWKLDYIRCQVVQSFDWLDSKSERMKKDSDQMIASINLCTQTAKEASKQALEAKESITEFSRDLGNLVSVHEEFLDSWRQISKVKKR